MTTHTSTSETNEVSVRRIPTEMLDEGDTERVTDRFTDFVYHVPPTPVTLAGPKGFERVHTAFQAGFPELHHTEIELVAAGDRADARLVGSGTHDGAFLGIAPAGATKEVTRMETNRLEDSAITEGWLNIDTAGSLQQLGAGQVE